VCPQPLPGDVDFNLRDPLSYYAMSASSMQCSTVYAASADGSDPILSEPRKPPDAAKASSCRN
jgi:hypothetical protein